MPFLSFLFNLLRIESEVKPELEIELESEIVSALEMEKRIEIDVTLTLAPDHSWLEPRQLSQVATLSRLKRGIPKPFRPNL